MNELTLANWKEQFTRQLLDLFPDVELSKTEHIEPLYMTIQTLLDLQKEESDKEKDESYKDLRRCFVALVKQLGEVRVSAKTLAEVNLDTEVVQFGIDSDSEEMIFKYKE